MVEKTTGETPDFAYPRSDADKAYKYAYAAFQNTEWVGQPQFAQPPETIDAFNAIAKELEQDGIRDEATRLLRDIDALPPEVQEKLRHVRQMLDDAIGTGSSKGFDKAAVARAIEDAKAEANTSRADSQEEKINKLWGAIDKLNKEVKDILNPHLTEAQREELQELERRKKEAKEAGDKEAQIAIEKKIIEFNKRVTGDLKENGTPEAREAAKKAEPKLEELVKTYYEAVKQEHLKSATKTKDDKLATSTLKANNLDTGKVASYPASVADPGQSLGSPSTPPSPKGKGSPAVSDTL